MMQNRVENKRHAHANDHAGLSLHERIDLLRFSKKGKLSAMYNNRTPKQQVVEHELAEQVAFVEWANQTQWKDGYVIGDFLTHVVSEKRRPPQARKRLSDLGSGQGYPKLILDIPTFEFPGLRLEIKAPEPHYSYVTKAQSEWHEKLRAMGYRVEICKSCDEAIEIVKNYLKLS